MPKKRKKTRLTARPTSGDQRPRNRLQTPLKWVGGVTAILSLIFGLYQITQLVSDVRERQRHIAELYEVGKLQQGTADYDGAWVSFDKALKTAQLDGKLAKLTGQLGKERLKLREAQEDLAMEWLENVRVPEGQTFSDTVDKLFPILSRGVVSASGARKADILAHVGWANFLRWRDGHRSLNPEQQYRHALEIDSANPYAHVHWGHWKLWRRGKLKDARQHFSAAIASGRVRDYVRRIQLAALQNFGSEGEFLTVVNDMWKNNEKIDSRTRNDVYNIYYFTCAGYYRDDRFQKLLAAVPVTEQLAMFQGLFLDEDFDKPSSSLDACLATLLEAAGQREEALRIWLKLRSEFPPKDGGGLGDRAVAAINRLSPNR